MKDVVRKHQPQN